MYSYKVYILQQIPVVLKIIITIHFIIVLEYIQ
jgi:hypothetical protein